MYGSITSSISRTAIFSVDMTTEESTNTVKIICFILVTLPQLKKKNYPMALEE